MKSNKIKKKNSGSKEHYKPTWEELIRENQQNDINHNLPIAINKDYQMVTATNLIEIGAK